MYDETTFQPSFDPQADSQVAASHQPAPADDRRRNRALVLLGVSAGILVALVAGVLLLTRSNPVALADASASHGTAVSTGAPSTAAGPSSTAGADATQSSTTDAPSSAGPATPGASNTGGAPKSNPAPKPQGSTGPAPAVTSVSSPDTIDCHNGNSQTFTLSWTTTNATSVTVSIDGGAPKTYPANGTANAFFSCPGPHRYDVTAHASNGKTATRSITLKGRNVQVPTPGDDDSPAPAGPSTTVKK